MIRDYRAHLIETLAKDMIGKRGNFKSLAQPQSYIMQSALIDRDNDSDVIYVAKNNSPL